MRRDEPVLHPFAAVGAAGIAAQVRVTGRGTDPYEARAAVLIDETWRGWEGVPPTLVMRFAGAELATPASPDRE